MFDGKVLDVTSAAGETAPTRGTLLPWLAAVELLAWATGFTLLLRVLMRGKASDRERT